MYGNMSGYNKSHYLKKIYLYPKSYQYKNVRNRTDIIQVLST